MKGLALALVALAMGIPTGLAAQSGGAAATACPPSARESSVLLAIRAAQTFARASSGQFGNSDPKAQARIYRGTAEGQLAKCPDDVRLKLIVGDALAREAMFSVDAVAAQQLIAKSWNLLRPYSRDERYGQGGQFSEISGMLIDTDDLAELSLEAEAAGAPPGAIFTSPRMAPIDRDLSAVALSILRWTEKKGFYSRSAHGFLDQARAACNPPPKKEEMAYGLCSDVALYRAAYSALVATAEQDAGKRKQLAKSIDAELKLFRAAHGAPNAAVWTAQHEAWLQGELTKP